MPSETATIMNMFRNVYIYSENDLRPLLWDLEQFSEMAVGFLRRQQDFVWRQRAFCLGIAFPVSGG